MNLDDDEYNKTKIIMDKKDCKMTRLDKHNYLFEYEIVNNNILLEKIINMDFLKLLYELNKDDILDDFHLELNNSENATAYILFKHFFSDFGLPQKYANLNVSIEKTTDRIVFRTSTNVNDPLVKILNKEAELIPIEHVTAICDFVNPHRASIKTMTSFHKSLNLPEFIEKMATTIMSKILLRTKQFIEKLSFINTV